MKIVCIGGGPAGLYFAISMKLRDPAHDVLVVERNRPNDTFGWGVVLSDDVMDRMAANDPVSAAAIRGQFAHWDDITVHFRGQSLTSSGHGFSGIGRQQMLLILQERARDLGVRLRFETEIEVADLDRYADADLIIACDGLNSKIRAHYTEHFQPDIDVRPNKFIWLGTHQSFNDAFTFIFEKLPEGWIFAHCYQFDKDTSTFIVECGEDTWRALGFEGMSGEEAIATCERLFARYLNGHALMSNARHLRGSGMWLNFPRVSCAKWSYGNIILMGDAVHTAHYSIGSGTRLAVEDAMDLTVLLHDGRSRDDALRAYEETRGLEVLRLQSAARNSMTWFEDLDRYVDQEPMQFMYSLLTRSQRVSHENLRLRDNAWLESVEDWFADRAFAAVGRSRTKRTPPMLTPFKLRDMVLENRIVVSPMCMYSAVEGLVGDWHLVHYGSRALGGAGLVMTEMTNISAEARITPGCAGLYSDAHEAAWTRIVEFVHANSAAKIGLQLGHAGSKGATKLLWDGYDQPLEQGAWPLIAPSDIPWAPGNQVPRAMTRADMDQVKAAYVQAAERAARCGFDLLELHCAHGYLLSAFITPLMNQRQDDYGGSLENRLRYPLEVFRAIRAVWPAQKPMSVRISASDWVPEHGITPQDAVAIARAFAAAGVDIVDVSAGQTSPEASPVYGRMFQTPFSDQVRNEAGVATMAVGNIYETDHVNSIITAGRADLCCLARPHLANPHWTLHAAAGLGFGRVQWPKQYLSSRDQLQRNLARAADMASFDDGTAV